MTIKRKIIQGYAITLGIAIAGTFCGSLVGNSYQQKVFSEYQRTAEEYRQLSRLQLDILYNRPTKQLSPYINNPTAFERESQKLIERVQRIQMLLQSGRGVDSFSTLEGLTELLEQYQIDVDNFYNKSINSFQRIDQKIITLDREKIAEAQNLIVELAKSPEFVAFIEFPDRLYPFHTQLAAKRQTLQIKLQNAERLRTIIIATSFLISISIAAVLISYTSSSITYPLEKVTKFSKKILQNSDFTSQVTVQSNDETKILADSINQLVKKVNDLLQELQNKTSDLEQALTTVNQQQIHLIAQKMSGLRQLVAGIAHEINNPVTFIYGNVEYLEECFYILLEIVNIYDKYYPDTVPELLEYCEDKELDFVREDLPKSLDSIRSGANRVRDIVLSLRSFSRMDESSCKKVNIHDGIDSTLLILEHRLEMQRHRPAIEVIKHYDLLPKIECYPGQLNQVFMNLLTNAIDALDECYAKHEDATDNILQIQIITLAVDRQSIQIAIADNADGIPESVLDQIFNPFFTTKSVGEGTGMGLAISYQIIHEMHRGTIACNSTPGEGSEFIITIPVYHDTKNK